MSRRILPKICCGLAVLTAGTTVLAGQQHAQAATDGFDQRAATYVESLEGAPYTYGSTGPGSFDCSGLTQYVYGRLGKGINRSAEAQFEQFRPVSQSQARAGDLVFFHQNSDPNSYVYHVGVYEGGDDMVAASSSRGQVTWQSFSWAGNTVTFGTLTH